MIYPLHLMKLSFTGYLAFMMAACAAGGDEVINPLPTTTVSPPPVDPAPTNDSDIHTIPRLASGPHMGLTIGFDDLTPRGPTSTCNPDRSARANELYDEAISRGKTIGRLLVDWSELEPKRGVYDEDALMEAIAAAQEGDVAVFMTLSTLDSGMVTFPSYLAANEQQLLPGIQLNGTEVTEALNDLLEWLVPKLAEHNVWALSLGNEPDANIDEQFSAEDISSFFAAASRTVRRIDADLPTAVTLSFSAAAQQPEFTSDIMDELDIMMMNYGCGNQAGEVAGESTWREELDIWKAAAKGKPIVVQELTCPVGYGFESTCESGRPMGRLMGNPQVQADFFRFAAEAFAEDEQLRAAIVFQLFDWSPENAKLFGDFLRAEGMPIWADLFEESLATTGLCRWSDTVCRDAWGAWLDGLELLEFARENLSD